MTPLARIFFFTLALGAGAFAAGFVHGRESGMVAGVHSVTTLSVNRDAKADRASSPRPNLEAGKQAAPPGL
jgi:hypothetical protein